MAIELTKNGHESCSVEKTIRCSSDIMQIFNCKFLSQYCV